MKTKTSTEVVLCTFNGAPFVCEQLDSIVEQTTPVDRISIWDDASTDDTVAVIRGWIDRRAARGAPVIDLRVNRVNLGFRRNFEQAIARATGDVLFLCDQDDVWDPAKVDMLLWLLEIRQVDMAFSDGRVLDARGTVRPGVSVLMEYGLDTRRIAQFHGEAFDLLLKRNYVNGASCAIRRAAAQSALPFPAEIPHDYWLALWCAMQGGIAATPRCLYGYRQHSSNAIGVGSTNPLYLWLGIWRHPLQPRRRELRIWNAVSDRLASLGLPWQFGVARRKAQWLARVVAGHSKIARAYEIVKSAGNGSYSTYASDGALLRDVVALIRGRH